MPPPCCAPARACLIFLLQVVQGNWFEPLQSLKGQFNGIVSNPPYIAHEDISNLQVIALITAWHRTICNSVAAF